MIKVKSVAIYLLSVVIFYCNQGYSEEEEEERRFINISLLMVCCLFKIFSHKILSMNK